MRHRKRMAAHPPLPSCDAPADALSTRFSGEAYYWAGGAGLRLMLVASLVVSTLSARTWYVDSRNGNDASDGLAENRAWKTLDRLNSADLTAGDRVLLRAGSEFHGQLKVRWPVAVDKYGDGKLPLIAADGKFHEALLIENTDNVEVSNLELTNTGVKREPFRYGARIRAWDHGVMRNVRLKGLFVHDVNGSLVKKDEGEGHGIVWENGGQKVKSRFDGLIIENCHLVRTDRNGICGFVPYPSEDKTNLSTNVVIRGNVLEDIGGDGIKVWGCKGALVERNVLRNARQRCDDYAAGIWPWASDDTVIQFNEVSGTKGTKDGQAFDSDAYTANTIFQYNYSHDNDGGFMLLCCSHNTGTVVRYNISQNDHARLFHMADGNENLSIYNNVFFVGKEDDVQMFLWTGHGSEWTHGARISNNVFYVAGTARNTQGKSRNPDGTFAGGPGFGGSTGIVFEKNDVFGNVQDVPPEWKALAVDPMLRAPGTGVDGYKLLPGSPLKGAGTVIRDNGGRDYWGKPIPVPPSIGADSGN